MRLQLLAASTAMFAISACGASGDKPNRPRPVAPKDDWHRSATWLYATDRAPSGHGPECEHVEKVLDKETGCAGALCKHPAALASEWLDKCAKTHPKSMEKVSDLEAQLSEESERKPSKCAKSFARFIDEGCDREHCKDDAQAWATRCGGTEGTPLVVSILAKVVERHIGSEKPIKLDARSCESLEEDVEEGSECEDEASCKKALKVLTTLEKRCIDPNETPSMLDAMQAISIRAGAVKDLDDAVTVTGEPERLDQDDLPLVLADGTGAVLSVCHQRVTELDDYLRERDKCAGGFVHLARVFGSGDEREIRFGEMPVRTGWDMLDMFPRLAVIGERRRVEKRVTKAFEQQVDAAIAAGGTVGAGKLVGAIEEHARWLFRTRRMQKALSKRSDELAPLYMAIAEAKVAAGKNMDAAVRRGIAFRARTRPLADVSKEGTISADAGTAAWWLDTELLLPDSSAAYREALAPLHKEVTRGPKLTSSDATHAARATKIAADACHGAQEESEKARKGLVACVFEGCDDDAIAALMDQRNEADVAAANGLTGLLRAVSSVQSTQLDEVADSAGCTLPLR